MQLSILSLEVYNHVLNRCTYFEMTEFTDMFEHIALVRTKFVKAAPILMNTMTFSGRFDVQNIPIEKIRSKMKASNIENVSLAVSKIMKHRHISTRNTNKFSHQVSFNIGTSCIKLFFNGSIHGTGFCSSKNFVASSEIIAKLIQSICDYEEQPKLIEFRTNLINFSTAIFDSSWNPLKFNLKKLSEAFMRNNIRAYFDPEKHSACKVVLFDDNDKKLITGFIFSTGSISIFGSKEPKYIAQMYETILKIMDDNVHISMHCDLRNTTLKNHFSVSHGYPQSSVNLLN